MREFMAIVGVIGFSFFIMQGFASCVVNDDWIDAPCLDTISNGNYDQKEVEKWKGYYKYKGTEFMEQKRGEMEEAIKEDSLQQWIRSSTQNENVYSYYYFSGRAPDIGIYHAGFEEFMKDESSTIHDPYTDDERYQLAKSKVPLGGLGINPEFDLILIFGIVVGVTLPVFLILFWRKRAKFTEH